jgi:hypothetical protein
VLVTLAVDTETAEIDPKAPFMGNSRRRVTRYNRPNEDEPGVTEQFRPGERQARFEAEWDEGGLDIREANGRRLIAAHYEALGFFACKCRRLDREGA